MILAIETSCDETSVRVLDGDGSVRVNLIAPRSSGISPSAGSSRDCPRVKFAAPLSLITRALQDAKLAWSDIDASQYRRAGLIGALLVVSLVRRDWPTPLAFRSSRSIISKAHIYSAYLQSESQRYRCRTVFLSLVSQAGIHRSRSADGAITMLNRTRDDAIGETFDQGRQFIACRIRAARRSRSMRTRTRRPEAVPFLDAAVQHRSIDFLLLRYESWSHSTAREHSITATATRAVAI